MRHPGMFIRLAAFLGTPLLVWLALPGRFSIWPLLFVCLVPLLLLVSGSAGAWSAARRSLVVGIIMYVLLLYWIISVLQQYGGLPWFVAAAALLLLAFYMSLYLALFSAGFYLLGSRGPYWLVLIAVPALWVGLDWLRSWLFGGFPWMDLGYGLFSLPRAIQAADLFGHHIFTFLIVLVNLAAATLLSRKASLPRKISGAGAALLLILALGGYSLLRWNDMAEQVVRAEKSVVGIVQGNIRQDMKWSPTERQRTVEHYLALSSQLVTAAPVSLIVWPETALPFYPRDNELLQPVAAFARQHGVALLTGAPWYEIVDPQKRLVNYFNSALLMTGGTFTGSYHKSHLVPYGEYVPLKRYMPFLAPLVEAAGDFTPGEVGVPLAAGALRAGVLICYESIFADIGRAWVNNEANVLVNLTNDAWYGKSSAPYQSWAMTLFRSVETRRSLVRSANTGISGVIDPLGRVLVKSELFVPWAEAVPVPLLEQESFFVRGGFLFAPFCAVFSLAALLGMALTAQRRRESVV